ncbi:histone methyltransferase set2 [Cryptotrichosporon argae]
MGDADLQGMSHVKLEPAQVDVPEAKPAASEVTGNVKREADPSTLAADLFARPLTPPVPLSSRARSPDPPSRAPEPSSSRKPARKKKAATPPLRQLIGGLPDAWAPAHATFEALDKCVYERKDLGLSREQDEMMVCDCVWDRDDPHADPCGSHSDCINRAIFIECLADECRAGRHCHNQRFAKREYAPVDIVQTEMKGFGLRAAGDIPAGSLIYEYIGEVVVEKTFRKRMQLYADEGIKHFYFMMLQKEEYIDATKKGGIGRFANHSCNPNCEVQKWVVGRRLRMGIFTQRDVEKGEELTFNYNVDRYGHDAQICYCGEPNCVGTIGGKTQTDLGAMNPLFLDALGITDEVEEMQLKGSKKKKSRQLDEDYVPILHPIEVHEVPKVAAAIRQSMENKRMMSRLLERVKMTEEGAIHRQLLRMHGFSLMTMILTGMAAEPDVARLALESMAKWQISYRNKIEDSHVEQPVRALAEGADVDLAKLASDLLAYWSTLELSYRIPRVNKIASLDADDDRDTTTIAEANSVSRRRTDDALANNAAIELVLAPVQYRAPAPPLRRPPPPPPAPAPRTPQVNADRLRLDAIIAGAQAAAAAVVTASPAAESSTSGSRNDDPPERKRQRTVDGDDDDERKSKRLTKLIGQEVVRNMSKYKEQMSHDTFKRYARDCTATLVEKEKQRSSYAAHRHPQLSDEKKAKIKAFTKEYAHKILKKLKERGQLRRPGTATGASQSQRTPADETRSLSTPSVSHTDLLTPAEGDLVDDVFGDLDERDGGDTPGSASGSPASGQKVNGHGLGGAGGDGLDSPLDGAHMRGSDVDMASSTETRAVVVDRIEGLKRAGSRPKLVDHFDGLPRARTGDDVHRASHD